MRRLSIAGKIWFSIGVFVAGAVISLAVSQVESVRAEARLRLTNEALFPAAQMGQQAEAAFERMAKGFLDAVLLEETSKLNQAEQDGIATAAALNAASAVPGLNAQRAKSLSTLASAVSAFARDAHAGYGPMLTAGGTLAADIGATSRRLAEQTEELRKSVRGASTQLAGDLQGQLAGAVRASVWQRWLSLIAFFTALGISGAIATVTIRQAIVRPIRAAIGELTETAGQVASTSGHVAGASQSLSRNATEQAASLEETSASMEEMASMTRKNAENSQAVAGLMGEVDEKVQASNHSLTEMVAAMASIQESSRQVAKIIKAIDEIAFQTNLLALNAAVEAARAGDAGMGFAVVAEEVRNLAQRSAQAAKDTEQLIEASIDRTQDGNLKVEQVARAISGITGSIASVRALVEDVSTASRQQAQGIDQVSEAIAQMDKVTQTTAATAEESAAASEELRAQADGSMRAIRQLEDLVDGGMTANGAPAAQTAKVGAPVAPFIPMTTPRTSSAGRRPFRAVRPPPAGAVSNRYSA